MVELDKFEKEIPEDMQEPLMVKMGFDMHSSNKLWRKTVRLGNKDVTLWVDFRGSNKPKYWTQPKIGDVKSLGEIRALEAVMDGTLDAKEWDVSKPITVTKPDGSEITISLYKNDKKKEKKEDRNKMKKSEAEEPELKEPEIVEMIPVTKMEISVAEAKRQMQQLQQFVDEVMEKDVDYGVIEGTNKSSLWKSGAEKLLNVHGMSAEFELVDKVEDWENGFFYYRYKCIIKSRKYNEIIAECEGSCNSKERKYRNQDPYSIVNTLQKMAQKRSLVGATLIATRTSMKFVDAE